MDNFSREIYKINSVREIKPKLKYRVNKSRYVSFLLSGFLLLTLIIEIVMLYNILSRVIV